MINKEKNYNLNLDWLVLCFLLNKEIICERVWFKNDEKYKTMAEQCYRDFSSENDMLRWENRNWTVNLFGKQISFVLERKINEKWKEIWVIEKLFFINRDKKVNSFEMQLTKLLEIFFKEKIMKFSENSLKLKLRFYGEDEENKPDILITLVNQKNDSQENNLALDITECDNSPYLIKGKGSFYKFLDAKIQEILEGKSEKEREEARKKAKEMNDFLERIDTKLCFPYLLKNVKTTLTTKKVNKKYGCEKTVIWIIASVYCHVDIKNKENGNTYCFVFGNEDLKDEVNDCFKILFSRFFLQETRELANELQRCQQKIECDYLIIQYSEANQIMLLDDGSFFKSIDFAKKTLWVPVISGEIKTKIEEQLREIDNKYKNKLDNLKITLYGIGPDWRTTKLLMDDNEKKYYEEREKKNINEIFSFFSKK